MNALQRDLKRLVPMVEAAGAARAPALPSGPKPAARAAGARSALTTSSPALSTARRSSPGMPGMVPPVWNLPA